MPEIVRDNSSKSLIEIRLAGRGGQGVVTAGDLLGSAAVGEGRWAQSIPTFGPERRGALAMSTLRLSHDEILLKCTTARPDVLLVLDPTVWHHANIVLGLREGATLVFNTLTPPDEVETALRSGQYGYRLAIEACRVCCVDATGIALETLGKAITNTAMIGAFVGATGHLPMSAIESVFSTRFGKKAAANLDAAKAASDGLVETGD